MQTLVDACTPARFDYSQYQDSYAGYDSDAFRAEIESRDAEAVIPPRSNRLEQRDYDKEEYKKRNVVERFINAIKQCRRVATRYEKTARNFLAVVSFAAIFVLLN